MAFLKEFKEFALKGNVMDMAVGVIIGGAFGKIVSSLVNDILMPPIGALIGNTDFSQLRLDISKFRDMTSSAVHAVGDVVTAKPLQRRLPSPFTGITAPSSSSASTSRFWHSASS
mgnify:CR=1 FL=1